MSSASEGTLEEFRDALEREDLRANFESIMEITAMNSMTAVLLTDPNTLNDEGMKARLEAQRKIREASRAAFAGKEHPGHPIPLWTIDVWSDALEVMLPSDDPRRQRVLSAPLYGRQANAWTIQHAKGEVVVFDLILDSLLNYMNQALLLAIQRARTTGGLSEEFFRKVLAPYLLYYAVLPSPVVLPAVRAESKPAYVLRKRLTRNQLHFIVAHELAHVTRAHNRTTSEVAPLHNSSAHYNVYDRSYDMEFEADLDAAHATVQIAVKRTSLGDDDAAEKASADILAAASELYDVMEYSRLSIELLFVYLEAFEWSLHYIAQTLYGHESQIPTTHPPARQRGERVRAAWPDFDLGHKNRQLVSFASDAVVATWQKYLRSLPEKAVRELVQEIKTGGAA